MHKHTAGPWTFRTDGWLDNHGNISAPTHGAIAEALISCDGISLEDELCHNGLLMAHAPQLLDALEEVSAWLHSTYLDLQHKLVIICVNTLMH
ncbi:hypothetical protein [Dickeya phage Amaethon]|nr:hypothetical protein [Dickeya phage Amaethon]